MINFVNVEQPLKIEDIEEIETFSGVTFPNEYKEHLLKYNGGQCKPNGFTFIEKGIETKSNVDWFLAIYDGEYDNLKSYILVYKIEEKRVPSQMIPIAHDPGGNLICISCGIRDNGFIYFWDHESEVDYNLFADSNYSNLYLIEKGFSAFMLALF